MFSKSSELIMGSCFSCFLVSGFFSFSNLERFQSITVPLLSLLLLDIIFISYQLRLTNFHHNSKQHQPLDVNVPSICLVFSAYPEQSSRKCKLQSPHFQKLATN